MGFFDKLKASVGIGQPKVEINLESAQIKRGDSIRGTAILTGGSGEAPIKYVTIEHVEIITRKEWNSSREQMVDTKTKNIINKLQIPKDNEILPAGGVMRIDFELPVSTGAMNTGFPYAHELKVSLDVPGLDPTRTVEIFIL